MSMNEAGPQKSEGPQTAADRTKGRIESKINALRRDQEGDHTEEINKLEAQLMAYMTDEEMRDYFERSKNPEEKAEEAINATVQALGEKVAGESEKVARIMNNQTDGAMAGIPDFDREAFVAQTKGKLDKLRTRLEEKLNARQEKALLALRTLKADPKENIS